MLKFSIAVTVVWVPLGRGCCLEPMPLCPNGGRAIQRCNRGVDCPQGFGCTSSGGCCMLSLDQVCPSRENAVCQCSPTSGCPPQASCNMGTCCASGVTLLDLLLFGYHPVRLRRLAVELIGKTMAQTWPELSFLKQTFSRKSVPFEPNVKNFWYSSPISSWCLHE